MFPSKLARTLFLFFFSYEKVRPMTCYIREVRSDVIYIVIRVGGFVFFPRFFFIFYPFRAVVSFLAELGGLRVYVY